MKTFLFIVAAILVLSTSFAQKNPPVPSKTKLNVYYFHLTNRCPTCIKIEATTKKVLEENFKKELDSEIIVFQSFNVDLPENKVICEKYQAYGATLALTPIINGKEKIDDLTNFAFAKIHNGDAFYNDLKLKIQFYLK
jgi:thiol-disulfide isomerase/thioredoxin